MKVQKCKGMRDLSPQQMAVFRLIEGVFRDACLKWGYGEIKTPVIEFLHLFTSAGTLTPETLGRVYSFLDWDGWSGERVVLRPDGTIPAARMYIESMAGLARLFYLTNVFTFNATGDESRERWQLGAELIGPGSRLADVELISLSLNVLRKLGLTEIELRLSHAGFIRALLAGMGIGSDEQNKAFDRIMDGKPESLASLGTGSELVPLLSLEGQSAGYLKNLKALTGSGLPEVRARLDDFIDLVTILDDIGIQYRIDIRSGGGFEYYTGAIFEIYINGVKVGGGGRYDALIPSMGGGNVPASGFALYINRLMDLVQPKAMAAPRRILIRNHATTTKPAFQAAQELRDAGYIAEIELDRQDGYTWTLDVEGNGQFFLQCLAGRAELGSIKDVLKFLEGNGGD